jgi:hypothetical protein
MTPATKPLLVWLLSCLCGCYAPTIGDGMIRCAPGNVCPDGYACAVDGACYQNGHSPPGAAPQLVAAGGSLASVAADESLVAYLTQTGKIGGVRTGALTVARLSSPTTPLFTDANAFSAYFSSVGANTLFYFVNGMVTSDPGSTVAYGQLKVWLPGLAKPVQLSSGFAPGMASSPRGAFVIFHDTKTPSTLASGNVVLARSSDCSGMACASTTLSSNVLVHDESFHVSNDDNYAAYAVKSGGATPTYQVFLVNVPGKTQTLVATGSFAPAISFSPDGTLLAVGMGSLQLFNTASAQTVAWAAIPTDTVRVYGLSFADSQTLIALLTQSAFGQHLFTITAGAATQLSTNTVQHFELPHDTANTTATSRYCVANTTMTNGVGDLQLYDLTARPPTPTQLATAASVDSVAISHDSSTLRFLDHYDPVSEHGDLTVVALASGGAPALVAPNIGLDAPFFAGANELFYIDNSSPSQVLSQFKNGHSLKLASGVWHAIPRSTPAAMMYFSNTVADTVFGLAPGVYAMPLP